jgi:hypothetical protein
MSQISFDDLFAEESNEKISEETPSSHTSPLEMSIMNFLMTGITSVREICETLIKDEVISIDRFSTNKPKDHIPVCTILDRLVLENKVIFVEDKDKKDRFYKIKENEF